MQLLPWPSLAGKARGDPGLCLLEKAPQQSTSPGRSLPTLSTMKRLHVCREGSPQETASTFLVRAEKEASAPHLLTRPLSDEAKLGTMAPGAELVLRCGKCTHAGDHRHQEGKSFPRRASCPEQPLCSRGPCPSTSPPERPATAHGPACSTGSLVGAHRPGFPSRSQTWQEMKGFTSLAPISASSPCRMGRGELLLSSAARWDEFLPSGRASEPGARQRGAKGGKRRKGCGSCTRVNGNDPRHCRHLLSAPSLPLRHGLPPSCSPMPGFAAGERSRPSPTCCPASCQKGGRRQAPLATSAP